MKGFGDDFGFHFGRSWEDAEATGTTGVVEYSSINGVVVGNDVAVAPGSLNVVSYSSVDGSAEGAVKRRRGRWVIRETEIRQEAEAPGSVGVIRYVSTSGRAFGEASATGSISTIGFDLVPGKATGQKVFVVSGRAFGDAKAPGAISEISVSAVEGTIFNRLDNDFLLADGDATVHPVDVDNDLLLAA